MGKYTIGEIELFKSKAEKWDRLYEAISDFYLNEDGEYDEENPKVHGDLCDIGEIAAEHLGWL